jgi:hypothetical protein
MEIDTTWMRWVLTFASVEGPRGGGTMEVMRQATHLKAIPVTRDGQRFGFRFGFAIVNAVVLRPGSEPPHMPPSR